MAQNIDIRRALIVFCLILSIPQFINGGPIYKTKTMYVGDSFSISPWSELNSTPELSGCTCMSTSCRCTTPNAFSIEITSTTTTSYWYENLHQHGSYSTYKLTALKSGTFEVIGSASGIRYKNMVWEVGIGTSVIYTITVKEKPVVTSITIPSTLNILVGSSYTFSPVIAEEGATTQLTWTSSDPSIVSVTSGGVIKAIKVGNVTITCTASNGVSANCVVTVSPITVSSITLDKTELELTVGNQYTLIANILPNNATNKTIEWSSSNENVAFVSANGTVIGISPGYCNVFASSTDGSNKKASCLVHIVDVDDVEAYVILRDSTITFYYDREKSSRPGSYYSIDNHYSEEVKAPWASQDVNSAVFDPSFMNYHPTSTAFWFHNCTSLLSIKNLEYLTTDSVTSMNSMFTQCRSLTDLDLSHFNTNEVTDMGKMFYGCLSLDFLDLSSFETNKVTDMYWMFRECRRLTSLDLSTFVTDNVTRMDFMFSGCARLSSLNIINFNTEKATTFRAMFENCSSLHSIDLSRFDTKNVLRTDYMFKGCSSLSAVDISHFDTSKISNVSRMFEGCTNLTSIDLSQQMSNKKNIYAGYLFADCSNLRKINLNNGMHDFYQTDGMFKNCTSLKTVYISEDWNFSGILSQDMFENCTSIIGNSGTCFNPLWISYEYAHIDKGESAPGYFTLLGDVNSDGIVNISDTTKLVSLLLSGEAKNYASADVDFNGIINISDVTALIQILLQDK